MHESIMILTRENLHALSGHATGDGFTKAQIELLGFTWPPQKGWLTSLIGSEITDAQYQEVKEAYDIKGKKGRKLKGQSSFFGELG